MVCGQVADKKGYLSEGFKGKKWKIPLRWVVGVGIEKFSINFFFEKKHEFITLKMA